jgi:HEAT repeat protein
MCDEAQVRSLIEKLQISEDTELQSIAESIVDCGMTAVEPILEVVRGDNSRTKAYLIWSLSQLIEPAVFVKELIALLPHQRGYTREYIVKYLAQFKTPAVVEALIPALIANLGRDREAYYAHAFALEKLPTYGDAIVEPLIAALRERLPYQSELFDSHLASIVNVLGRIGDPRAVNPLVEALKLTRNSEVANTIYHSLKAFGSAAVPLLIDIINAPNTDPFTFGHVVRTFGALPIDNDVVELLLRILATTKGDLWVQQNAVSILGRSGDKRAFEPIRDVYLNNAEYYVRESAILALQELRLPEVEPILIKASQSDPSVPVRRRACEGLSLYSSDSVVQALIAAFYDDGQGVAFAASRSLFSMIDKARPLLQKIHKENPEIIDSAYSHYSWEWVDAARNNLYTNIDPEIAEFLDCGDLEMFKTDHLKEVHDCPICGTPAADLAWFCFYYPPEIYEKRIGAGLGWMTVCDHCHLQVDSFAYWSM